MSWPRSPCSRAASRSSDVSRLICTRFFATEIAHALEFLVDQRHLLGLGVLLRGQAGDLLVQLFDTLLQLVFLSEPGLAPQLEQFALASNASCTSGSSTWSASSLGTATVSAPSRSAASRARRA